MTRRRKIFVSAQSAELGSYRLVAERYLRQCGYETTHQEIFGQSCESVGALLRDHLASCDAVVCLIGRRFGAEPASPIGEYGRRSWTQLEHALATELGCPTFLLLTDPEATVLLDSPADEPPEQQQLQAAFRDEVVRDRDWCTFCNEDQLLSRLATLHFPWMSGGVATLDDQAERDEAEQERRRMLAEAFGMDAGEFAERLPDYAAAYLAGDVLEAERLALAAAQATFAAQGTSQQVRAYWIAGLAAQQAERPRDALDHLQKGEAMVDREAMPHLWVRLHSAIGYVHLTRGDHALARSRLEAVVEAAVEVFGPDHPLTLADLGNLASSETALGDAAAAEPRVRRLLDIRRVQLGPEHPRTLAARNKLANCLSQQGKREEAEEHYLELRRVCVKLFGAEHPRTLVQHFNIAHNLAEQELHDEAIEEYSELLRLCERVHGAQDPEVASVLNDLAWTLYEAHDLTRALPYAQRAVKILKESYGRRHVETLQARHTLSTILGALGELEEAERGFQSLVRDQVSVLGDTHVDTLTSRHDFSALLHRHADDSGEALCQARVALEHARDALGEEHPITRRCRELLASMGG